MKTLLLLLALAQDRPNVLVIVSDDQRADSVGVRTPNLDALARDGVSFRRAYCMGAMQGAVCVPSRAMFLTGRSLFRVSESLNQGEALWPRVMADAGYDVYAAGKWHNGRPSYQRAFPAGGPIFFGGMGNQNRVKVWDAVDGDRVGDGYSTDLFCDAAERFLRGHAGPKPFFLYVSLTTPHDPRALPPDASMHVDPATVTLPANFLPEHPFDNGEMDVRDEKLLSKPRKPEDVRRELAAYQASITYLDARVGRLLKILEESGRRKNTIVAFFSDHGLALGSHGLLGKQNLYEHSMRAPLILSGPGVPKGTVSDAMGYLFDVFPTVAGLCKVPLPDGVEGKPLLEGPGRPAIFTAYRNVQRAVRNGRWKLIRYPKVRRTQLFDLQEDPDERRDLSAERTERVRELSALLAAEAKAWGDPLPPD
jgi:arylsulfatase A-like enzyme